MATYQQNIQINTPNLSKIDALAKKAIDIFANEGRLQAIDWLREQIEEHPNELQLNHLLGKYLLESKNADEGIKILEDILIDHEGHLATLLELGNHYTKPGYVIKAATYYKKAAALYPKHSDVQVAYGTLYQRKGDFQLAVEHYREGLALQLKNQITKNDPPPKDSFRVADAERLLWETMDLLFRYGIHMFPAFGSMLGIVRDGKLMAHDKDIDCGIPFSEMERTLKIMSSYGWTEVYNSFGYLTSRAMYNHKYNLSMDVSGFLVDRNTKKILTGVWYPGVPKEWNMFNEFTPFTLEKIETLDGKGHSWFVKEKELWLKEMYGDDWRIPDKDFDSTVRAKNLIGFSLLTKCFAYSRIYSNWVSGNFRRARILARDVLTMDPNDRLIQKIIAKLSN